MRGNGTIRIEQFLERVFIQEKLNNWVGLVLMLLLALGFGGLLATKTLVGFGLMGAILGFFIVLVCLINSEAGLYINIAYSFFAFHLSRYLFNDEFPVGIFTDVLIGATLLSLFFRTDSFKKAIGKFMHSPVTIGMLLFVFYLLIEFFNPHGQTFEGWFQTFRRFLGSLALLLIAFCVFDKRAAIRRFIIVLFCLALIVAFYGIVQQVHGLFGFELAWATADPNRFGLIFIGGNFRKFSTTSDPTAFGILMAVCAVFFLVLSLRQKSFLQKLVLIGGAGIMMVSMAYSGTRTANVMVVAGAAMYVLLSINRKETFIFAAVSSLVFATLLFGPFYGNPTLNRFRSSFEGSEDPSFKVREVNRKFIQPYVWDHPIGGGLGTTGGGGSKYAPNHYLAGFPPDSGYLKKALETGYIGLALICILYYVILRVGIRNYFRSRSPGNRFFFAAALASLFSFYVAEFAQEAIGQITDIVVYYPLVALMMRLRWLEEEERETAQPDQNSLNA